jgi:hypothetical protein
MVLNCCIVSPVLNAYHFQSLSLIIQSPIYLLDLTADIKIFDMLVTHVTSMSNISHNKRYNVQEVRAIRNFVGARYKLLRVPG